jgi:hypothetical protein
MGDTLNFTVTATQGGSPVTVTASGDLATNFDSGTGIFSWVGAFGAEPVVGRHELTFTAGGDSVLVIVGVTEFAIVDFLLVDPTEPGSPPFPGDIISIPVGGQQLVLAQPLCNPFGTLTPNCGMGTNGWKNFVWTITDPSVAEFVSVGTTSAIEGVSVGMTPVEARFTDALVGEWSATATIDVQ